MSFEHNSVRKILFLTACFGWDSGLSLREMDQKFKFGGLIGYGNSCLDSVFRYSKVFRLHAILNDAAGAVRSHSGKGRAYCYMIGRGPISCSPGHVTGQIFCLYIPRSCSLGHVTGQIFCLYIELFLPSIFNSVDF